MADRWPIEASKISSVLAIADTENNRSTGRARSAVCEPDFRCIPISSRIPMPLALQRNPFHH